MRACKLHKTLSKMNAFGCPKKFLPKIYALDPSLSPMKVAQTLQKPPPNHQLMQSLSEPLVRTHWIGAHPANSDLANFRGPD